MADNLLKPELFNCDTENLFHVSQYIFWLYSSAHLQVNDALIFLASVVAGHHQTHMWLINTLTHWGRVTHMCVSSDITIIGLDNGLSPGVTF